MLSEIRIYAEGGGDRKDSKQQIRCGFGEFLRELRDLARQRRIHWRIIAAGPRNSAFDDFMTALETHPDAFNVLLVDSEAAVNTAPWEHLAQRDGWRVTNVPADHCHFMVQSMEAWLIADVDALERFYGPNLQKSCIPDNPNVEEIDKERLESALKDATRNTQKGCYHKIRHAAKLLELVNPDTVRSKATHCERLFTTINRLLSES